jgi:hypothetical protein
MDDHDQIAIEQYLHWREIGLSHAAMLRALGVDPPPWTDASLVVRYLARAHRALQALRVAA